ncbi:MAG: restriction endonuclease [Chloroflexota bacterium]
MSADPKWLIYERIVAAMENENREVEFSVTRNAKIKGFCSEQLRQVDILVDARWEQDLSHRTIVDAKLRKRKIDIKEVESFLGMMDDCRADRGILYCSSGFTKGAKKRARGSLRLIPFAPDFEDDSFMLSFNGCTGQCSSLPMQDRGWVLWDSHLAWAIDGRGVFIKTGKCDLCHNFVVECAGCAKTMTIQEYTLSTCACGYNFTSGEGYVDKDEKDIVNYLLLIMPNMPPVVLDSVWLT